MFELLKIIFGLIFGFTGLIILKYEGLSVIEIITVIGIFTISVFFIISAVQNIQKYEKFK